MLSKTCYQKHVIKKADFSRRQPSKLLYKIDKSKNPVFNSDRFKLLKTFNFKHCLLRKYSLLRKT